MTLMSILPGDEIFSHSHRCNITPDKIYCIATTIATTLESQTAVHQSKPGSTSTSIDLTSRNTGVQQSRNLKRSDQLSQRSRDGVTQHDPPGVIHADEEQ